MFGLYIIGDNIYPEIHAFKTVQDAVQHANNVVNEYGMKLDDTDKIDANDKGFYASCDCGHTTFECCKIIVH